MSISTTCIRISTLSLLCVAASGCGTAREDRLLQEPPTHPAIESVQENMFSGFVHEMGRSRFDVGRATGDARELDWSKTVGTNGTFATRPQSGCAMGVSNADSPSLRARALTESATVHNERTRSYFVESGIPENQIDKVGVYTLMAASGPSSQDGHAAAAPKFVAYTSSISRTIDGFPILGSVAWARFNEHDQTVDEGACWPEIPKHVVDDAKTLQRVVTDSKLGPEYHARLPTISKEGRVVIHHPSIAMNVRPTFEVSYDVVEKAGKGMSVTRHFDVGGHEVRTIEERASVPVGAPPGTPPPGTSGIPGGSPIVK